MSETPAEQDQEYRSISGFGECPICLEKFLELKVLKCQHTYCTSCLVAMCSQLVRDQKGVENLQQEIQLVCAQCRQTTSMPNSGDSMKMVCKLQNRQFAFLKCEFCWKDKELEDAWWCR